jgi:hypothetical protein
VPRTRSSSRRPPPARKGVADRPAGACDFGKRTLISAGLPSVPALSSRSCTAPRDERSNSAGAVRPASAVPPPSRLAAA